MNTKTCLPPASALTHVPVPRDPAKGLREYLDEVAPGALADRYVRQALARLLEAVEEATAPADDGEQAANERMHDTHRI
jgi:hypothetical protein